LIDPLKINYLDGGSGAILLLISWIELYYLKERGIPGGKQELEATK
jgi:hypothetical protein